MTESYNRDADSLPVSFGSSRAVEAEEVLPGLIVHFDEAGRIVALGVLHASVLTKGATDRLWRAAW